MPKPAAVLLSLFTLLWCAISKSKERDFTKMRKKNLRLKGCSTEVVEQANFENGQRNQRGFASSFECIALRVGVQFNSCHPRFYAFFYENMSVRGQVFRATCTAPHSYFNKPCKLPKLKCKVKKKLFPNCRLVSSLKGRERRGPEFVLSKSCALVLRPGEIQSGWIWADSHGEEKIELFFISIKKDLLLWKNLFGHYLQCLCCRCSPPPPA